MMRAVKYTKIFITLLLCFIFLCSCSADNKNYDAGYKAGYAAGYAAALKERSSSEISIVTTLPTEPEYNYYVINKKTKVFHIPSCHSVDDMNEANKIYFSGSREDIIENGFSLF